MTKKRKGILASIFVMFSQGSEGIIIMLFALIAAFAGIIATPAFAAASLWVKELFTLVISIAVFGNKRLITIFKKGITKVGLRYSLAFILGSSIGSIFYILAITIAGPGMGGILTAMYPVFASIMLRIFFKEKATALAWVGIFITIVAGAMFVSIPAIVDGSKFDLMTVLGMLLGLVTAIAWASEGVIIHGIKSKDSSWTDRDLAVWKSTSSFIFLSVIALPISVSFGNPYSIIGDIFMSWKAILITFGMAINLIAMRVAFTYSVGNAGVRLTSIIDTNNFLVAPLITVLLSQSHLKYANDNSKEIFVPLPWWAWLIVIPILIGVVMVIYFTNKSQDVLDHEK